MLDGKYFVSRGRTADLARVAQFARMQDRDELWASSHRTPTSVLSLAERISPEVYVGWRNNTPICAFGVTPINTLSGHGSPWMVGTIYLDKCGWGFLKASRVVVQSMFNRWEVLENYVDDRNKKAIAWLRWLGFEIMPAEPHGLDGLPFHRFVRRRSNV